MATGGAERNTGDDFRQTCGLCMESYRGRQPKLLPCFHTFCLPCLTTLAETAATSANTRQSETSTEGKQQEEKSERVEAAVADTGSENTHDKTEDRGEDGDASGVDSAVPDSTGGDGGGDGRFAVSGEGGGGGAQTGPAVVFLCPTCRSPVTVPDGGVKNLQTNFYLDYDEADDTSRVSRPVPCDMCEEDQKQDATHACEECRVQLCRPCRKIHDKFPGARAHHLTPLGQGDRPATQMEKKMCLYHPDQRLCFFCQKCDVSICLLCKLTLHESHVTVDLAVAAANAKTELTGLIEKAKQQTKVIGAFLDRLDHNERHFVSKKQQLTREVHTRYDTALAWLTQARDDFLHALTTKEQTFLRDNHAEKTAALVTMETLSAVQGRAVRRGGPDMDVFAMKNELRSALLDENTMELYNTRATEESPVMRCSANTSALTLDLVQDYIGDLEEAAEDTAAGRRGTSVSDLADVVADLKKGFTELQSRAKDSDDRIAELTADLTSRLDDVALDMGLLRQSVAFNARFSGSSQALYPFSSFPKEGK